MFTKWIIKALRKRLKKMSVNEQNAVRELGESAEYELSHADKPKSDTKHKSKKVLKEKKIMPGEKELEKKVETSETDKTTKNNEVDKTAATDKVDDKKEEVTKKEETVETKGEEGEPAPETQPVTDTEPVGNGIRIEDLVTKEEMLERFSAFEAKYEAVIKENTDLKNELAKAKEEANGLKDKYETKDFGNMSRQGVMDKNKDANETFDSYSKQFM